MKKILITTEIFTVGGLETHLIGEVAALSRMGCEVHLAIGQNFSDLLLPSPLASVTTGLNFGPHATLAGLAEAIEKLRHIIRSHKIECIHAHPFSSLIASCIAAELEGITFAVTLHGPASLHVSYGPVYDFLIKSIILPQASLVVAISDEVAQLVLPYVAPTALALLPNSIAASDYTGMDATTTDMRWLVVSRLDSEKIMGVLDLVEKAHAIGAQGVRIVGDGPSMQQLHEMLSAKNLLDFVEFMGFRTDVRALMHDSVYVAGMGRVALEGLAEKKPVILVGYDGVKGVMEPGLFQQASLANFSGRNLPTVDAGKLKNQISEITDESQNKLSQLIKENFSEDHVWACFLDRLNSAPSLQPSITCNAYLAMRSLGSLDSTEFLQSGETLKFLFKSMPDKSNIYPDLTSSLYLAKIEHIDSMLAERNDQIFLLEQKIEQQEAQIKDLRQQEQQLEKILQSASWRITQPLRAINRLYRTAKDNP